MGKIDAHSLQGFADYDKTYYSKRIKKSVQLWNAISVIDNM